MSKPFVHMKFDKCIQQNYYFHVMQNKIFLATVLDYDFDTFHRSSVHSEQIQLKNDVCLCMSQVHRVMKLREKLGNHSPKEVTVAQNSVKAHSCTVAFLSQYLPFLY